MEKTKVFHFHNGSGGGVLSVMKNLLKYSENPAIENHVIFTINKDLLPEFKMPVLEGAKTQQEFYYSPNWNFYYTCRQLANLLPDDKSVVVAHDWVELGMVSNLGLQNPVVHMLHGDFEYYYELAKKHEASINHFIAVSPVIFSKLCSMLSDRKADIHYCRFPVPAANPIRKANKLLNVIYCVRSLTEERKQFKILPLINEKLTAKGLKINWTIVGTGMGKEAIENVMNHQSGLSFFPALSNEEVMNLLPQHDLFILPSLKEGFPVAVVEAMKAGLVPLVTNWEGATKELIVEGETGFYFERGDARGYADKIELLNKDRALMDKMSRAGIEKANQLFDPVDNTRLIEDVILEALVNSGKKKKAVKVYGSRLDQKWIKNSLTYTIRNALKIKNA